MQAAEVIGRPVAAGVRSATADSRRVLLGIIAVSVTVRIFSALLQGDRIEQLPGIFDQYSYDVLARRVLGGFGFTFPENWWPATRAGEPTAHWSFLYTGCLAAVYSVFGWHPLAARLLQAVAAGILHPLLTARIGERIFGRTAGLAAASVVALYSYFVYYAGALMTEAIYILAILWALDLATSIDGRKPGNLRRYLLLGLALGLGILLRQAFLLFVPALFGWMLARAARSGSGGAVKRCVAGWLAASAVMACLILPWTVRNYRAFGRFVLLNSNAGYVLFWANHPIHGTSFIPILPGTKYVELIPPPLLKLNEAELDRELLSLGARTVLDNPGRFALLSISRAREYFKFWPSPDSGWKSNVARILSFGLLIPLALLGAWKSFSLRRSQPDRQAWPEFLLYLFVAVYSLIHLVSWTLIRYRLPVDAVLVLFAGAGIAFFLQRHDSRFRFDAA